MTRCLSVHLSPPPMKDGSWEICTFFHTDRKRSKEQSSSNTPFKAQCTRSLCQKEKLQIISTWPALRTDGREKKKKKTLLCLFVFNAARRFSYWRKTVVERLVEGNKWDLYVYMLFAFRLPWVRATLERVCRSLNVCNSSGRIKPNWLGNSIKRSARHFQWKWKLVTHGQQHKTQNVPAAPPLILLMRQVMKRQPDGKVK